MLSGFARSHSARTGGEFSNRIAPTITFPNGVWERGKLRRQVRSQMQLGNEGNFLGLADLNYRSLSYTVKRIWPIFCFCVLALSLVWLILEACTGFRHLDRSAIFGGIGGGVSVLLFNLSRPRRYCPRCDMVLPRFRIPRSLRQLWFGGWTCPYCGCEVDKLGNEIRMGQAGRHA